MIINRIYENKNLLSLQLVSFLVGLRTYQHPCNIGHIAGCVVWKWQGFLISSLIISVISKQHEDREKYGPGEDEARMYSGE
jgi:hypothetical protein